MTANWAETALADSELRVFWTDPNRGHRERGRPPVEFTGGLDADLTIVGGGFTGLWAAVHALETNPGRRVVVIDGNECGFGASTRNGGFCDASLTHGLENGVSHWPHDIDTLVRLGTENLNGIEATLGRHDIDADFRRTGELAVATEEWHVSEVADAAQLCDAHGIAATVLDESQVRSRVASPTYLAGLHIRDEVAMVDPAALIDGLRRTAERLGCIIYEHSPVLGIDRATRHVVVSTRGGAIRSGAVICATNAYRSPVRRARKYTIPVYDHVLATEPLSDAQLASIGWEGREGISDMANQFHYYRLTPDNRILWGGYDATYHWLSRVHPRFDDRPATHQTLARHFFETFPQLEGLRFTHRWGGPIAATTKFAPMWKLDRTGTIVSVGGYTGLGVGASRFAAQVALELLDGESNERTELEIVRRPPRRFPPEPIRGVGVALTKRSIARSDRNGGRRGPWLRVLDRLGIGFDS